MKFYSEITKQLYDSQEELAKAEMKIKERHEAAKKAEAEQKKQRATRAKEVQAAIEVANEAQTKANTLFKNFIKDYGHFHMSYTSETPISIEDKVTSFWNLVETFLK